MVIDLYEPRRIGDLYRVDFNNFHLPRLAVVYIRIISEYKAVAYVPSNGENFYGVHFFNWELL